MNILSWFPFVRREEPASPGTPGTGPITGCDLSRLDALTRPFAQGPFYRLRPPFSYDAAALSLELADMTYSLDLDAWTEAGWGDASILIDDSLHSGVAHPESGERLKSFVNNIRLLRAKADLKEWNPVSQLKSALRQREKSDTVKAVCMMHPMEGGRYLLAIGFMGTGSRFYDWFSNFRFTTEEGFHRGFYQLTQSFEDNAESIQFPETAAALGLEKLTLGQVLLEMRSLSSRFRLWMAGHSQGGAVMQVFAHRLITDWGVLAQNMVGYGFASPTVATGKLVVDPASYPLYHILNTDDVVPMLGALVHLGLCLDYPSNDTMRSLVYDPIEDEEDRAAMQLLRPFREGMHDTPSAMLHITALLECLAQEKGEDGLRELMSRWWAFAAVDRVLLQAGGRVMDLFERIRGALQAGYAAMTGRLMKEETLSVLREEIRPVVQSVSVRRLVSALMLYALPPHRMVFRDEKSADGAYAYIVKNGLKELRPFIWVKPAKGLPVREYARWTDAESWPEPIPVFCRAKRGARIIPERKGKLRLAARQTR